MKKALVTGAARRLGGAMALALAQEGYDVAVHYASSRPQAQSVVDDIKAVGRNAIALEADLLDETQMNSLLDRAAQALGGPITALINNASIFEYDEIATATRESWDRHIDSNLRAPFVLTQHFAAQCPKALPDAQGEPQAQGIIVNMIDQRVRKLTPAFSTYTLAKSALWTLTQTAAMEFAPDIRVNGIGPGPTLQGERQTEAHFRKQRQSTILKRGADPKAICDALRYILRAHSVTGQLICVDGGQHLAWETPDIIGNIE